MVLRAMALGFYPEICTSLSSREAFLLRAIAELSVANNAKRLRSLRIITQAGPFEQGLVGM